MTKLGQLLALCLSLPVASAAQIGAGFTVPSIKTEIVNGRLGPRVGLFLVTNEAQTSITAMHFSYGCHVKQSQFFDSLVYPTRPIGHLATWTSSFGSEEIPACPGGVDAAVFADGHSEGDPKAIEKIYNQRKGVYNGITFALPLLDDVVRSGEERPHVFTSLSNQSNQIRVNLALPIDERIGEAFLLGIVGQCLSNEQPVLLPFERGRPREPDADAVMKAQNLDHTQAAAYVLKRKLSEWQKTLEGNLRGQPQ